MGLILLFVLAYGISPSSAECFGFPSADILYVGQNIKLSLLGNPQTFVPSSVYTVQLDSSPFERFMLTAESSTNEGIFQVLDKEKTSSYEVCLNTIVEARNDIKKDSVQALWISPNSGCVSLRAAAKTNGVWQVTNKTICALESNDDGNDGLRTCCACDHAKYKIIFEGLWSPETHPKDFPKHLWLTHFSDLIGASHSSEFSMWGEGRIASYGFKQLAEFGVVRELETELRNKSAQLRSIIKAAGLWYPNLNGNTTAVFRVDPRRHLLSFASMFGPSPDWVVGVSSLNLCQPNCTWISDGVIDLYPYDAGTDDGVTYMSVNTPTDPQERIRKITPMYPEDPRAPFYDPSNKDMKPLAKLYLSRESVIPKLCSDLTEAEILAQVSFSENTEEEARAECEVTPYSQWSPCSVTCGKGIRMRKREYVSEDMSKLFGCDRQLVAKEMCVAETPNCPGDSEEDVQPLVSPGECEVTAWSDWSDCSVSCGIGFILRTRNFISEKGQVHKKCMHISTMEKEKCMLPPCKIEEIEVPAACAVTEWSEWSPCSVTCGKGERVRVREFMSLSPPKFCIAVTHLTQSHSCTNNRSCNIDSSDSKVICALDLTAGPCRGKFRKWGYNSEKHTCVPFYYGGCRGNKNRFDTLEDCKRTCDSSKGNENKLINCVVSKWSDWSSCHPCRNGTKTKTRNILIFPRNGGRDCPVLTKTISCSTPEEFCN